MSDPENVTDPDGLPWLPNDLQSQLNGILRNAQTYAATRAAEMGIAPFTTIIALGQATIQSCLQVSRPVTIRMFRHYLDAMEAPRDSVKYRHHASKAAAAASQLAEIMLAKHGASGNA